MSNRKTKGGKRAQKSLPPLPPTPPPEEPHRWTTPKASQTASLIGVAVGAAVSLLGDWTAFSLGVVIMLLAAGATIHIHKVEIGEAIAGRKWDPRLTFPAAAIAILVCVAGYAFYRTSHPKPDETAQLLAAIKEGRAPAALQGRLTYANLEAKLYDRAERNAGLYGTVVKLCL